MRRRVRPSRRLLLVEGLAVVLWLVILGHWALRPDQEERLVPIDPAVLAEGPGSEQWMGVFFEDSPIGWSVTSELPTKDGGLVIQNQSVFRLLNVGQVQEVITVGRALLDQDRRLLAFDILMDSQAVRMAARGEVRPARLVMEVHQAGEVQELELPLSEPPHLSMSLVPALAGRDLVVGERFQVPYFDPISLAQDQMQVTVTDVEVLPGTAEEAFWLTMSFQGMETRRLVTTSGDTLREEGGLGLSMVRMTREQARELVKISEPPDLVSMAAVRVAETIQNPRDVTRVTLRIGGVDPARIPDEPPLQRVLGDQVSLDIPLALEIPELPLLDPDALDLPEDLAPHLESSFLLPARHAEIRDKAAEVIGGAASRKEAVTRLVRWVHRNVEKRPVAGIPNGLEVLRRLQGDCNEHTALFVSMARAVGVPARIVTGLTYAASGDGREGFFYHAWAEVHLGGPTGWVPVDPTFGQIPADATHLKLVEGDLDRQVELIGLMGKLELEVLDAR